MWRISTFICARSSVLDTRFAATGSSSGQPPVRALTRSGPNSFIRSSSSDT